MTEEKISLDRQETEPASTTKPYLKPILLAFGWLCVVLGAIGAVTPGLPTTIFLIMAAWAFARSSQRFHTWLFAHKYFGPVIRDWDNYRVIPVKAKIFAIVMMTASVIYVVLYVAEDWLLPGLMLMVMVPTAIYIVSRNSRAPTNIS